MAKIESGLNTGKSEPEAVDAYMNDLEHPLREVVQSLRKAILSVDKSIGEGIFWNAPTFYYTGNMKPFDPKTYKRYIVGFNLFRKDCVRLIFLRGATVSDPNGLLEGDYEDGRRLALFHGPEDFKRHLKDLKGIVKRLLKSFDD